MSNEDDKLPKKYINLTAGFETMQKMSIEKINGRNNNFQEIAATIFVGNSD